MLLFALLAEDPGAARGVCVEALDGRDVKERVVRVLLAQAVLTAGGPWLVGVECPESLWGVFLVVDGAQPEDPDPPVLTRVLDAYVADDKPIVHPIDLVGAGLEEPLRPCGVVRAGSSGQAVPPHPVPSEDAAHMVLDWLRGERDDGSGLVRKLECQLPHTLVLHQKRRANIAAGPSGFRSTKGLCSPNKPCNDT